MIRCGIAGFGDTGKKRYQWIKDHEDMRVSCYSDISSGGDGMWGDFHEMIMYESKYLDALFVCLPNYLAPDACIAGLKAGLHVFCEKPPGDTLEAVDAVRHFSNQNPDLKLKYGFNHRYHDSVMQAMDILPTLGKIIHMRGVYGKSRLTPFKGNWRSDKKYAGGGILLDQGIHMLDLFRYFAGAEFTGVQGVVSNGHYRKDVEDNAYAILTTDEGVVGTIHSSATLWNHTFQLDIGCAHGYLKLSGILSGTKSYGEETLTVGKRALGMVGVQEETATKYLDDWSWKREIDEFYDCIVNNKPVVNGSVEDAMKSMELVFKIYSESK